MLGSPPPAPQPPRAAAASPPGKPVAATAPTREAKHTRHTPTRRIKVGHPLALPEHLPVPLDAATASLNAWAELDLAALNQNARALRAAIGPATETIAVVKANAYGAGAAPFARELQSAGVERFAVAWAAEAIALRAAGITKPIIVLGHSFPGDAADAVRHNLTLTVHSLELGHALSREAAAAGTTATVHIKIDTGMHRFGNTLEEAATLAETLRTLPGIDVEGLATHMANADEEDDSFSDQQHERFAAAVQRLPWIRYRHTANSATALRRPEYRFDGARIGLALHGILPDNTPNPGLRPVLSVRARLGRVADVAPGGGVSYGLTWRAQQPARAGLVPVGYADGWPRNLGNTAHVLVHGQPAPMIGRVCMDQFLADVTAIPQAREGSIVTLLGTDGGREITANHLADLAGTISWDIIAGLTARLPRLAHRNGSVEAIA